MAERVVRRVLRARWPAPRRTRFTDAWTTFASGRKTWGYLQDQLPSTHPVAADMPDAERGRGELRRDQLRQGRLGAQAAGRLGRAGTVLRRHPGLLRRARLGQRHARRPAGALEASSGRDLADWSRAWLETAGPNTLRSDSGRRRRRVHLVRGAAGGPPSVPDAAAAPHRHRPVRPRRRRAGPDPPRGDRRRGPAHRGAGAGRRRQPDLVLLNDDDLDYALIRFDARSHHDPDRGRSATSPTRSPARCAGTRPSTWLREAELPFPVFVRMLAGAWARSPRSRCCRSCTRSPAQLLTLAGDPAWVPDGKAELAERGARLLPPPSRAVTTSWRGRSCSAGRPPPRRSST